MNSLCIDVGWGSLNKHGEPLCGDRVQIIRKTEDGSLVMVLADGLGSGVKANILATLTSKIISTMIANRMSLEQCIRAIASTLPVCEVRKIAYSTFTVIKIDPSMQADIIEYDNPQTIMLRDGKIYPYAKTISELSGKAIYRSHLQLKENDVLISMSDGALYASEGRFLDTKSWTRDDIGQYVTQIYTPEISAKNLQIALLEKIDSLYGHCPGDDTTIAVLKSRKRKSVDVMIGPPLSRQDDGRMLSLFFSKRGEKVVCGGTTASLVAKYLNQSILPVEPSNVPTDIPPMSYIEGVSLVTEGIITLNRVLLYAKNQLENPQAVPVYSCLPDGASQIAQLLIDQATDINFFVGKAVNIAHQNNAEFVEFGLKQTLVEQLSAILQQLDKTIKIYSF